MDNKFIQHLFHPYNENGDQSGYAKQEMLDLIADSIGAEDNDLLAVTVMRKNASGTIQKSVFMADSKTGYYGMSDLRMSPSESNSQAMKADMVMAEGQLQFLVDTALDKVLETRDEKYLTLMSGAYSDNVLDGTDKSIKDQVK